MVHAYLLARINVTKRKLEGVEIYSEPHPTNLAAPGEVCIYSELARASAPTFEEAAEDVGKVARKMLGKEWNPWRNELAVR